MKAGSLDFKLVKTSYVLIVILSKIKAFDNYIEKDKDIKKDILNKIIKSISLCSNINNDLIVFTQHQQKLIESFNIVHRKDILLYLSLNNKQIIKMIEKEIEKDRTIVV